MFGLFKRKPRNPSDPGSVLTAALVVHLLQQSEESYARFVMALGDADLHLISRDGSRLGNVVTTEGSDGHTYIAAFLDRAGAETVRQSMQIQGSSISTVSAFEIVFSLAPEIGLVLNPTEQRVIWSFTPSAMGELRQTYRSVVLTPGDLFTVRVKEAFGAAKILHVDERGVHLRVYANQWAERPAGLTPDELTLQSSVEGATAYGHLPITRDLFLGMGPKPAGHAPGVTEDELEGYRIWEADGGGYFGQAAE